MSIISRRTNAGFTIAELLITIAILGTVFTFIFPLLVQYLPGVPQEPEAAKHFWDSFWPSFWSGLGSGTLYSIFTGIIVGIIIIIFQKTIDKRQLHKEYSREFSLFKEELTYSLYQPDTSPLGPTVNTYPLLTKLANLLKQKPLSLWNDHLPEEKEFFLKIFSFQRTYLELVKAANDIDAYISQFVRLHLSTKGIGTFNDAQSIGYIVGRIVFKLENSTILPFLDYSTMPGWFPDLENQASQDHELLNKAECFITKRNQSSHAFEVLQEACSKVGRSYEMSA